jgi:hypothetical protein
MTRFQSDFLEPGSERVEPDLGDSETTGRNFRIADHPDITQHNAVSDD